MITVGSRVCPVRPLEGSATGYATGLCVLARSAREVVDAAYWMPGRILVLADAAVSRGSALLVGRSAQMATFAAVVVLSDEGMDLTDLEEITSPIPMVVVDRVADQEWLRHAVRITVEVKGPSGAALDLRTRRPERRHRVGVRLGVPGTVRPEHPALSIRP